MLKISHRHRPIYTYHRLDIYALLPEKVSFLERFLWSHIYFIRYCNNSTDITRNHFCEVFLKNHKNLRQMFLKCLRGVTEKTSVLRYDWDVLKTSQICRLFWDDSKRSLRCFSYWRSDWDLSETCYVGWNHVKSDIAQEMYSQNLRKKMIADKKTYTRFPNVQYRIFLSKPEAIVRRCFKK